MPPMKNIFNVFLLVYIVLCMACHAGENMNAKGQLVYTSGDGSINAIDFSSPDYNISLLYRSKEVAAIDHLTIVNNDAILFGECPIAGRCAIKQYSVGTGDSSFLRTGRLPGYISNHDRLFFYDRGPDGNSWLLSASLKNLNDAIKIIAKEPELKTLPNGIKQSITMPVIQISNDEILFVGEDGQLWRYNIANQELISMNISDCRPILWRERRNQLLCSDWDTWSLFLLDISTKNIIEMPELKGGYSFVYIPNSDSLVFGRTRSKYFVGEAYDIFQYSFVDKKENKIKKDSHIAAGVWLKSKN